MVLFLRVPSEFFNGCCNLITVGYIGVAILGISEAVLMIVISYFTCKYSSEAIRLFHMFASIFTELLYDFLRKIVFSKYCVFVL